MASKKTMRKMVKAYNTDADIFRWTRTKNGEVEKEQQAEKAALEEHKYKK